MKITEEKHNHKLTNLLKVFIFSVLMLLPFLNVAVRCGYVMLNKNAYQSAEITQTTYNRTPKYEQGDINNGLEVNKIYHLEISGFSPSDLSEEGTGLFHFAIVNGGFTDSFNYDTSDISDNFQEDNIDNLISYVFDFDNESITIDVFSDDYIQYISYIDVSGIYLNCDLLILSINGVEQSFFTNTTYQDYDYLEVESTTLDNVFEYSLNKLEEEQYLTWTQNTAVYQGVESMTTGLGITQTVIPMLIVYWFMLTIIYVIIDIILAIFTKLTHMIGSKTT